MFSVKNYYICKKYQNYEEITYIYYGGIAGLRCGYG